MGDSYKLDYSRIFGGRNRHRVVTALILLLVIGIFVWYQFTAPAQKNQIYANNKASRETALKSFGICDKFKDMDYKYLRAEARSILLKSKLFGVSKKQNFFADLRECL